MKIEKLTEKEQVTYYKELTKAYKRDLSKILKTVPNAIKVQRTNEIIQELYRASDLQDPFSQERYVSIDKAIEIFERYY